MLHSKAGYCQMFSGSMAELLRLLGIPARVAEGFTAGTYDPKAHAFRVTDHDAHAWVEAYFPGYGWLSFDPTPTRRLANDYSASSLLLGQLGSSSAPTLAGGSPAATSHHHDEAAPTGASGGQAHAPGAASRGARLGLLALAALLAAIGVVVAIKLALGALRLRRRDPRRAAEACRAVLVAYALDQGVELPPSLTHRELAAALALAFGVDAAAWGALAERAAFAPAPLAAAAAPALCSETRRVRRALRGALAARRRARGALSLRSMLRPRPSPAG
jgi:hypothetical protein